MHRHQIPEEKRNTFHRRFIAGTYKAYRLAKELRLSTVTTRGRYR